MSVETFTAIAFFPSSSDQASTLVGSCEGDEKRRCGGGAMYDGWSNLIGPIVFSGIITLAVSLVPKLREWGIEGFNRQREVAIVVKPVHQGGSGVWFHRRQS